MQLEKVIPPQTLEEALPNREPDPAYMRFVPDGGKHFSTWTSGARHRPKLGKVKDCTAAQVPIEDEDVEPLGEALRERNYGEMLRIIRKYVQTKGLGPNSDPMEGSVHEVPDDTILYKGRARVAKAQGYFSELSYPNTTGLK